MSRARRLFALARFLDAPTGRSLAEIAARFEVSSRTVFRDVAALEEQGILVEHLEGARYRLDAGAARSGAPVLDSTDLALVRVALGDLPPEGADPLARRLGRLLHKVETALRGRPVPAGGGAERDRRTLERLAGEGRAASFHYRSLAGPEHSRRVDPWRVFERAGAWYLAARCHHHDEPRLFRLERVRGVRAVEGRFEAPAGLDLERLLAEAWRRAGAVAPAGVEVALRLSPAAAASLPAAPRLADERRTRQPDGGLELRGRARDLEQATRLAVELGDEAVAIEPRELRVRLRRLASDALRER